MALVATLELLGASGVSAASRDFPVPVKLAPAVRFWTDVFTHYAQDEVLVHDRLRPEMVYAVVRRGGNPAGDARQIGDRLLLNSIVGPDPISGVLLKPSTRTDLVGSDQVRLQHGMREAFAQALTAQRLYHPIVNAALEREGLPSILAALPLIESSYHPDAMSHAGAVGLWQLARGTAQQYLRVDDAVDERRDPARASEAAAQYLHELRDTLPSWPLALTAYNHGLGGVERARRAVGSDDLGELVMRYHGPGFGFSARNYYAMFLAAAHVASHVGHYFPELAPGRMVEYRVRSGDTLYDVARRHGVTTRALRVANGISSSMIKPGQVLLVQL